MKKELTCIRCPMGCLITVETENGNVISVNGNTCKRGKEYAESECIHPERTVTSTIRSKSGEPVPVKSDRPIPKERVFDCMRIINNTQISKNVKAGDVIIENIFGCNIVATASYEM